MSNISEFTEQELAKLPQWVQVKVKVLHMRLAEAREMAEEVKANKPTRIWMGREPISQGDLDRRRFVSASEGLQVAMRPDYKAHWDRLSIKLDEVSNSLEVYSSSTLNELAVFPRSSNVLELRLVNRR